MSLPKINESISVNIEVPSMGKKFKARPYLAKEEKILLMAMESNDQENMLQSIMQILENCIEGLDVDNLTAFDVEYLFTKLRTISVSEYAEIKQNCENCQTPNNLKLDLRKVKISPEQKNLSVTLKIEKDIFIVLQYPRMKDILANKEFFTDQVASKSLYPFLKSIIQKVVWGEEQIIFENETERDQEDFIDRLKSSQVSQMVELMSNPPKTVLDYSFVCGNCQHENNSTLEGLANFFS